MRQQHLLQQQRLLNELPRSLENQQKLQLRQDWPDADKSAGS